MMWPHILGAKTMERYATTTGVRTRGMETGPKAKAVRARPEAAAKVCRRKMARGEDAGRSLSRKAHGMAAASARRNMETSRERPRWEDIRARRRSMLATGCQLAENKMMGAAVTGVNAWSTGS